MRVLLLAAAMAASISSTAYAHGDAAWIQDGMYKGSDGSSCCGVSDCHRVPREAAHAGPTGYEVQWRGRVFTIPYPEALVSENEDFWVCEKRDATLRCFFAPPMGA